MPASKNNKSTCFEIKINKKHALYSFLVLVFVVVGILSYRSFISGDLVIANTKDGKIFHSEVVEYLASVNQKTNENVTFDDLTEEQLEKVVKQIYLDKHLIKLAHESGVHNQAEVKERIETARNNIVKDAFIKSYVDEAVTADVLQDSYQAIVASLKGKKEYHISHIFLSDMDKAKKLRRVLTTANFAEKAKANSEDNVSKDKGGNLGFVQETLLAPEIVEVVEKLEDSEISDPFETKQGIQIIWRRSARDIQIPDYDKVEDKIKKKEVSVVLEEFYGGLIHEGEIKLKKN